MYVPMYGIILHHLSIYNTQVRNQSYEERIPALKCLITTRNNITSLKNAIIWHSISMNVWQSFIIYIGSEYPRDISTIHHSINIEILLNQHTQLCVRYSADVWCCKCYKILKWKLKRLNIELGINITALLYVLY